MMSSLMTINKTHDFTPISLFISQNQHIFSPFLFHFTIFITLSENSNHIHIKKVIRGILPFLLSK